MVCLQVLLFWMLVGSLLCSRGYCLPRLALSPISLDQARFFLYVADGLALFPAKAPPLLATSLLYFLAALGAPLSWEKLRMGHLQSFIGYAAGNSIQFGIAKCLLWTASL